MPTGLGRVVVHGLGQQISVGYVTVPNLIITHNLVGSVKVPYEIHVAHNGSTQLLCEIGLGLLQSVGALAHLVLLVGDVDDVDGKVPETAQNAGQLLTSHTIVFQIDLVNRVGLVFLSAVGQLTCCDVLQSQGLEFGYVVDHHGLGIGVLGILVSDPEQLVLQVVRCVNVRGVNITTRSQGHNSAVNIKYVDVRHFWHILGSTGQVGLTGTRITVHKNVHLVCKYVRGNKISVTHFLSPP